MSIIKVNNSDYLSKSDYRTHLNYARRMAVICKDMSISVNIPSAHKEYITAHDSDIKRFAKLSAMTAISIESDLHNSHEGVEFSSICAPWLPVKGYYRLYYLESILLALKGTDCGFKQEGHRKIRTVINAELRSGTIKYTTSFNHLGVYEIHQCMNMPAISKSSNITVDFWRKGESTKALLRLLSRYKFESWKKGRNLRTQQGRHERSKFMTRDISVFDYAYQMRLKANYKDLDFLDSSRITSSEAQKFIEAYHIFYAGYSKALVDAIHSLYPDSNSFVS